MLNIAITYINTYAMVCIYNMLINKYVECGI